MAKNIQYTFRRYEKKYILTPEQYRFIKERLPEHMVPDAYPEYTICNVYYDTPDYQLIRASLEKPVYKEKLRIRSYGVVGDGDKIFVELKKKFKDEVFKRRTTMTAFDAAAYLNNGIHPRREDQICREVDWFMSCYHPIPQVFIAYDREAYSGREMSDLRLTFDRNIRWRDTDLDLRAGDHGAAILPRDRILMEIKIPGAAPAWLARMLSEGKIFSTSFSKYGSCYRDNLCIPAAKFREERSYA